MLALTNGRILTMSGQDYERGTVLVREDKILAVGDRIAIPDGTEVIDVRGQTIMPGLIDAHCHLGIYEEIYRIEGNDANETSNPLTPELRAVDGINPFDRGFQDALAGGVTCVGVCPGSANVIGGACTAVKTFGSVVDHMIVKEITGMKVAFGENPKRVYGEQKKMPVTRMAVAAMLRQKLAQARAYLQKKAGAAGTPVEVDYGLEQLALVLQQEIPLRAHAHRADDIMTALRLAKEFQVPLVIEHCTEGHLIVDELRAAGVPAVVGPSLTSRAKVELKERTFKTPSLLSQAGVKVAICTDHPEVPVQYLSLCAALAVREGMEEREALKAITVHAAEILGIEHRVGSLAPGKDADLIVVDGSILEVKSRVKMVLVNGKEAWRAPEGCP
ncbi:MAG TPA: amidohydrolase [Clostridia bacterium]|nr:amidohydrolase [Clostridia bacterium]